MSAPQALTIDNTLIDDTYAEAFGMWAARLIVTARDEYWLRAATQAVCGYGTSVIACDAEVGVERWLNPEETPDDRPGVAILFFAFSAEALAKVLPKRTGQCLMTCPTVAVFSGLSDEIRLPLGNHLRFFGDGQQKSKCIAGRRYWRIPIMDGEFLCEDTAGASKAIGGGNFLIQAADQDSALKAARRAVEAMAPLEEIITPFPGGVVSCGSKVGSRYTGVKVSASLEHVPVVRSQVPSQLREGINSVLEIVIDGLSEQAIELTMRVGIQAAAGPGVVMISAGNYGGKLGKFHFPLHRIMKGGQ